MEELQLRNVEDLQLWNPRACPKELNLLLILLGLGKQNPKHGRACSNWEIPWKETTTTYERLNSTKESHTGIAQQPWFRVNSKLYHVDSQNPQQPNIAFLESTNNMGVKASSLTKELKNEIGGNIWKPNPQIPFQFTQKITFCMKKWRIQ